MKDTKDDTDGKIHPVPGLETSILSKWLHYPSQWLFFAELKQKIFKFVWSYKIPWIFKLILKKNKVEDITLPVCKLYCKNTVIKTAWYWLKGWNIDQWYRKQNPEKKKPMLLWSISLYKGGKSIQVGKDSLLINVVGKIR